MREYRGVSEKTGLWVYGDLIKSKTIIANGKFDCWILPRSIKPLGLTATSTDNFIKVIPETVGQFIGITDKQNRKIYERSFVSHRNYRDRFVSYQPEYCRYVLIDEDNRTMKINDFEKKHIELIYLDMINNDFPKE